MVVFFFPTKIAFPIQIVPQGPLLQGPGPGPQGPPQDHRGGGHHPYPPWGGGRTLGGGQGHRHRGPLGGPWSYIHNISSWTRGICFGRGVFEGGVFLENTRKKVDSVYFYVFQYFSMFWLGICFCLVWSLCPHMSLVHSFEFSIFCFFCQPSRAVASFTVFNVSIRFCFSFFYIVLCFSIFSILSMFHNFL